VIPRSRFYDWERYSEDNVPRILDGSRCWRVLWLANVAVARAHFCTTMSPSSAGCRSAAISHANTRVSRSSALELAEHMHLLHLSADPKERKRSHSSFRYQTWLRCRVCVSDGFGRVLSASLAHTACYSRLSGTAIMKLSTAIARFRAVLTPRSTAMSSFVV
jgi:hypothetical protein